MSNKLTPAIAKQLGVNRVTVYRDDVVFASMGNASRRYEGVEGGPQDYPRTQWQDKRTHRVVSTSPTPVAPVSAPVAPVPPVETLTLTAVRPPQDYTEAEIRAHIGSELDKIISGNLEQAVLAAQAATKAHREDHNVQTGQFRLLLDEAIQTYKERGAAIYAEEATKRGLVVKSDGDGVPRHDYIKTLAYIKAAQKVQDDAQTVARATELAKQVTSKASKVENNHVEAALKARTRLLKAAEAFDQALLGLSPAEKVTFDLAVQGK